MIKLNFLKLFTKYQWWRMFGQVAFLIIFYSTGAYVVIFFVVPLDGLFLLSDLIRRTKFRVEDEGAQIFLAFVIYSGWSLSYLLSLEEIEKINNVKIVLCTVIAGIMIKIIQFILPWSRYKIKYKTKRHIFLNYLMLFLLFVIMIKFIN